MPEKIKTFYSLHYPNISISVQFTTTAKGRPLMILDGYSYIRGHQTDKKKLTAIVKIIKSSIVITEYTHAILRVMQHM